MYERINEIILHGGEKQAIAQSSPWMSPSIYAIGEKKPEKKFRASMGFEPATSANTGVMLYQLSYMYEATHWEPGHFCGFYLYHEGNR